MNRYGRLSEASDVNVLTDLCGGRWRVLQLSLTRFFRERAAPFQLRSHDGEVRIADLLNQGQTQFGNRNLDRRIYAHFQVALTVHRHEQA